MMHLNAHIENFMLFHVTALTKGLRLTLVKFCNLLQTNLMSTHLQISEINFCNDDFNFEKNLCIEKM